MKSYLCLSLLFALTVSIPLFAQKEKNKETHQENFKVQYNLKELAKNIQKTEKQLKKNQQENISAIETIKAKTENLNEQNKKLQKDTSKISSELDKVLNRKIFELENREKDISYREKYIDWWLMILAIIVAVLGIGTPLILNSKMEKQEEKADKLQDKIEAEQKSIKKKNEELDVLIKTKKDEFNKLIETEEAGFKNVMAGFKKQITGEVKAQIKSMQKQEKLMTKGAKLINRAYQAVRDKNYSDAIDHYTQLIQMSSEDYLACMNLIELLIIVNNFDEAKRFLKKVKKYKKNVHYKSMISMLDTVLALAEGKNGEIELKQFKEDLKSKSSLNWSFENFEFWLESLEFKASPGFENKAKIQKDVIAPFETRKAELQAN